MAMDFPIFKTKLDGGKTYNLNDPQERLDYFQAKAGPEIEKLRKYLQDKTFVGYLLGKKNSGKGTYSKYFMEIVDSQHVGHISVGDIVRDIHKNIESDDTKRSELIEFLKSNYRGFHSVEETIDLILGRSQSTLISSDLILALIKFEISKRPKQALFFDGFPRAHDQINYVMYLKELIGYRHEPDFFALIDVANAVIDERIKYRVICPICKTPRNFKLLATREVGYDKTTGEFYLICENPGCNNARMVRKEGDDLGIEPIRERLEIDEQVSQKLLSLQGVPKVFLRNSVPVEVAKDYVDDYELTPAYEYSYDESTGKVTTIEKPWTTRDDNGVESYSLMPQAVTVAFIKQISQVLGL